MLQNFQTEILTGFLFLQRATELRICCSFSISMSKKHAFELKKRP